MSLITLVKGSSLKRVIFKAIDTQFHRYLSDGRFDKETIEQTKPTCVNLVFRFSDDPRYSGLYKHEEFR